MMDANMPVLVVIGTTGVGKSQLGIALAKALDGEVINADSMQVYKGLDIVTNKATSAERDGVPHHLMDFLEPTREYSVHDFEKDAVQAISQIHFRNRVPILVGGTNYYIQSLLWRQSIIHSQPSEQDTKAPIQPTVDVPHPSVVDHPLAGKIAEALAATDPRTKTPEQVAAYSSQPIMMQLLSEIDSVMAQRWHQNNDRKIRRSLQIFYTSGRRHSDIMAEQKANAVESGGHLRFKTCVFWLYADPTALYPRLDKRVDEMVKLGLFEELKEMRDKVRSGEVIGSARSPSASGEESDKEVDSGPNYTRGILQAIGFKEFDAYLTQSESSNPPSADELGRLRDQGLEDMKRATRQYAKRQVTWIRNKLAVRCLEDMENVRDDGGQLAMAFYLMDATTLDNWKTSVADKAIGIAGDFLLGNATPNPRTLSETAQKMLPPPQTTDTSQTNEWIKHTCPVCVDLKTKQPRVLVGKKEWDIHLASRGHRKMVAYKERVGDGRRRNDREEKRSSQGSNGEE